MKRNTLKIRYLLLIASLVLLAATVLADSADSLMAAQDTVAETVVTESTPDAAVLDKVLGQEVLFDDIALYAPAEVAHCGLGLVIRNSEGSRVSVAIHDAKGRPVLRERYDAGKAVINVRTDAFPTGVYVYTVHMSDTVYTRPFIVTR